MRSTTSSRRDVGVSSSTVGRDVSLIRRAIEIETIHVVGELIGHLCD